MGISLKFDYRRMVEAVERRYSGWIDVSVLLEFHVVQPNPEELRSRIEEVF